MDATNDPYVLQRQIFYRLNKQVLEENNNKHDLISVQNNFTTFENHVIEVMQQALGSFNQFVGGQAQKTATLYSDMLGAAQRVPPDFEWMNFAMRNTHILVDPASPDRTVDSITFPNQHHKSIQPVIEGTLSRKSRNKLSMSGYTTGHYVVTPSKFLHGFKDNDNYRNDPTPEISIYLPDATIGATNGDKFNVKGKDVSGGISSKLSGSSEIAFKANTASDAEKWFNVIKSTAGASPGSLKTGSMSSEPTSPISPTYEKRVVSQPPGYSAQQPGAIQTQGITGGQTVASPTSAVPHGAIDHTTTPAPNVGTVEKF